MSLHNDINCLNDTLQKTYKRELTEAEKRQKEKRQQQIAKKIMLENFTSYFEGMQNLDQIQTLTKNFIKNKKQNITVLAEYFQDVTGERANHQIIDFIDENYYKFMIQSKKDIETFYKMEQSELKKTQEEKQTKIAEKYAKIRQKEEEKAKKEREKQYILEQQQKQQAFNNLIVALKTITLILASPFILIMFFVWGICKNIDV